MIPRIDGLDGLRRILRKDLEGVNGIATLDTDRVGVISGYEGKGKSNLGLWLLDIWYKEIVKAEKYDEESIKYCASNMNEFAFALSEIKRSKLKYQMLMHDEAVKDLYKHESQQKLSKLLSKAYMLLRGMNMYSLLILPSITDLLIGFRTRRVTFLIHVFRRGQYAYWSKKRLSELMPALNVQLITNATPNPLTARNANGKLIPPNFIGTFPKYTGVLAKVYLERKQKNMELMIDEIDQFVKKQIEKEKNEDAPPKPKARELRRQKIVDMLEFNPKATKDDIVQELGISSATAYNELREAKLWIKKNQE